MEQPQFSPDRTTRPPAVEAGLVGSDPVFQRELAKLPAYAACEAGVLVLGETGTGKELCARAVHRQSARGGRPWVAVNCGALPAELVESELFGHVRGAFTTAVASRPGLVAEADGGTLFLDDVDCLPAPAQVKLLRFLQEGEFRPVGANTLRRADVRVIAAGSQRLPGMATRGEFRPDLYFRLAVLMLQLPALRERPGDIPELARHFVERFARRHRRPARALTGAALDRLAAHAWPGNVRELQHAIERAVILSPHGLLDAPDLDLADGLALAPRDAPPEPFGVAKGRVVRQFERGYIEQALARCEGNITRAAELAGKDRRAFFALMRKHAIAAAPFRPR